MTKITAAEKKKILRKIHPKAVSIVRVNDGGWSDGEYSVLEDDGFYEYWTSYIFNDNGQAKSIGTISVEI